MSSTLKQKIKLNLNISSSQVVMTLSNTTDHNFENELKPYRQKVVEQLHKTTLKKEYVDQLEGLLNQRTHIEAERLRCGRNFDLYKSLYLSICRHLIANLRPSNYVNNVHFVESINNGKINLSQAIEMDPQEMHHDRWRVLVEKKLIDIDKSTKDPEATTDMFRCGSCHRNKCKYFERQDRAADEPMTLHITCCYCGRRWKQ